MSAQPSETPVVTISSDAYRRLILLTLVENFSDGVYGAKRLEKVACIAERETEGERSFSFKRWHYGQYSDELEAIKDQLLTMGFLVATPLKSANQGNRYKVSEHQVGYHFRDCLEQINPTTAKVISSTVQEFGYLTESELVDICYAFPEFRELDVGEVIWNSDLPERIPVPLDADEADSLELSLNPIFVGNYPHIAMYIKGDRVEVTGMNNKKATLRVWADKGHGLLLCTDQGYHLGTITGEEPKVVGFPLSDIKKIDSIS